MLAYSRSIKGWMDPPELEWLYDAASKMNSIAEIGCWRGRSTSTLAYACPGQVYAVDHWLGSPDDATAFADAVGHDIYAEFVVNTGHLPNIKIVRTPSPQAAALVPDCDMVFIDGAHSYEYVIEDLKAWLPKTKRLISGHDWGQPGVDKAVRELVGEITNPPYTAIWFKYI